MRTMAMTEAEVEVSVGTATSNRGDGYVTLTVTDYGSGTMLARVELTLEQAWLLMQGRVTHLPGRVTDRPERIGKTARMGPLESLEVVPSLDLEEQQKDAERQMTERHGPADQPLLRWAVSRHRPGANTWKGQVCTWE